MMSQRRKAAQAEALRSKRRRTLVGAIAALAVLGLFAGLTVYNNLDSQPAEDKTEDSQSEQLLADCEPVGAARADDIKYEVAPAPSQAIAPGVLTFETNCGPIVLETDPAAAPATVGAFETMANDGYFNSTNCHRLTTSGIYVLQCGDPAGNGTGGPGFALPDENLPEDTENNYPAGTIAMANAGPGTGGSQFFIVYQDTTLGPNYTIFGRVIQGLDLVKKIADLGVQGGGQDGAPAQPVMIVNATYEP
jgi:peptidyl-prolyl cis-trans isomerase B (cyclophilin B)